MRLVIAVVLCILGSAACLAHEVRPAYLLFTETPQHAYQVTWKRPLMAQVSVRLVPHLSGGALEGRPVRIDTAADFELQTWYLAPGSLGGQTLWIEGLENTITDVLVMVQRNTGAQWQTVLTPSHPMTTLQGAGQAPVRYFKLGVIHILTGFDHLLFVTALLLLVSNRSALIKAITAFTAAHSITLALGALGLARVPIAFVDALIALSIAFMAAEVVHAVRGGTSLTIRQPWAAAFGFGLLHGLGFASGLTEVGMPAHAIAVALVLFNLGIEAGQLMFVAAVLAIAHAARTIGLTAPRAATTALAYLIGSLGGFWTLQRLLG